MSIYLDLTREFNNNRKRVILSSGQAVVFYRLAVMSKDGDWVLREDDEAIGFILQCLESHGARYRFGAPLDVRWLRGGWSSHFEFNSPGLRVRTDFVTRPPRLSAEDITSLWSSEQIVEVQGTGDNVPVLPLSMLAEIKKTMREKDYPVIGELARSMTTVEGRLLYSRSVRDLKELWQESPDVGKRLVQSRALLGKLESTDDELGAELDRERRELIAQDRRRMERYRLASEEWSKKWPTVEKECSSLSLREAHKRLVRAAEDVLPFEISL